MGVKRVDIHVVPNARKDEIIQDGAVLRVKTSAPPDRGRANRAVLKMLSKYFGARVRLVAGEKSRDKVIEYEDEQDGGGDGRN